MTSSKILNRLRTLALLYFILAACVTAIVLPADNSVKAPLLTLIGTSSLVVVLIPANITVINMGTIFGTATIMWGSRTWLIDAMQSDVGSEYLIFQITLFLTVSYVVVSLTRSLLFRRQSKKPAQAKSASSKRRIAVLAVLPIIVFVLHIIRSSVERRRQGDANA